MTVSTLDYTTATVNLINNYRKVQAPMFAAFKQATPEWDWYDDIDEQDIDISANVMSLPVDITRQGGAASIPESGYEAQTYTAPIQWATLSWINLNQRWFTSFTAKFLDERSKAGQISGARQLKYQAMKAMQSISTRVSQMTYGFTTGYVCQTSTNATQANGTYTLTGGYGVAGITDAAFLAGLFAIGDWVALVRSAALVTNAVGQVTAVSATNGTIDVTWAGSVDSDANDYIVFANNAINATAATLAAGTDYNAWPTGKLDMATSTSVHSLSGNTYPEWNPAYSSTTAGRFSAVKIRRAIQNISNKSAQSGGFAITMADGVERDFFANERSAVRYDDPNNMQLDGTYKYKNVEFRHSPNCPPGYVFVERKGSVGKFSLVPKPSDGTDSGWGDGVKAEDRNGLKFSINFPFAFVCRSRRGLSYFSSQTEQ
jgi:hypothetical protein